jgi:hypothetical protein
MRAAAEIGEHLLRAGDWPLGIDYPLGAAHGSDALSKGRVSFQDSKLTGEAQFDRCERRP